MGMIDTVKMPHEMQCINCGAQVSGFQTKDGKAANAAGVTGTLSEIEVKDVMEGGSMLTICNACQQCNEYVVWGSRIILDSIPMSRPYGCL